MYNVLKLIFVELNWLYIVIILAYVLLLFTVEYLVSRKDTDNNAFFTGNHKSPWYLVAFGMIGASISGISVVSVPGMVGAVHWTYLQTCMGFIVGYLIVAFILLPLYYKLNLTSIYEYLNIRFGSKSYHIGSAFFVIAKLVSSATKLYVVILVLDMFVFSKLNVPFAVVAICIVAIIWLYTRRSGIKTIVWTDSLQTLFFILAVVFMCVDVFGMLPDSFSFSEMYRSKLTDIFVWNDASSPLFFWKQFVSGAFIVVVMTGLDQDMMQKNITCRTLRQSQKNMIVYGTAFLPVNFVLLLLGTAILFVARYNNITLPDTPDNILPFFVSNYMTSLSSVCLLLGIIAASFSSADSALASITTTLAVDFFNVKALSSCQAVVLRKRLHLLVAVAFSLLVIAFGYTNTDSIIDTIYTIVGYAYGPLLGLFAFGLFTRRVPCDAAVPYIAIASPVLCLIIKYLFSYFFNYIFGYELLLLNGLLTFSGLFFASLNGRKFETDKL